MTQPGYVAPPAAGWWVRTNRVGVVTTGYDWTATTAVGERASQGGGTGAYTWAGASTGATPVMLTWVGAAADNATSIAIPTHVAGNLIVIGTYKIGANTVPTKPSAAGTVPAWVDIDANTGADNNAMRTAQFVATGSTTTSGTWTGADYIAVAVISNPFSTPIGGHAEAGSTATGFATAPLVSMSRTDSSSMLLHFMAKKGAATGFTAWDAPPTGYTQRATAVSTGFHSGIVLITKNSTTSDGLVTNTNNGTTLVGYRGATVEVRYH